MKVLNPDIIDQNLKINSMSDIKYLWDAVFLEIEDNFNVPVETHHHDIKQAVYFLQGFGYELNEKFVNFVMQNDRSE